MEVKKSVFPNTHKMVPCPDCMARLAKLKAEAVKLGLIQATDAPDVAKLMALMEGRS
jgi:hypothetical protein